MLLLIGNLKEWETLIIIKKYSYYGISLYINDDLKEIRSDGVKKIV